MKMTNEEQARVETEEVVATEKPEMVSEQVPHVETEEDKERKEKTDAEVKSILASLGIEPETELKEGHTSINSDFYTEHMNDINELRQTIGTIANRLMMSLIGEYKLELTEVGIDPETLDPATFNNALQSFAQVHFDKNLDELFNAAKGSATVEQAFCHAITILSYTVGFSIKSSYVHFDLVTVQVLHMMQKQFHTAYTKNEIEKEKADAPDEQVEAE